MMIRVSVLFVFLSVTFVTAQDRAHRNHQRELARTQAQAAEAFLRLNQVGEAKEILSRMDTSALRWETRLLKSRADRSVMTLKEHSERVVGVAINSTGQLLATGGADEKINLWNTSDGSIIRTMHAHRGPVTTLDITPDDRYLLSGSTDKSVKLWELRTGQEIRSYSTDFSQGIYQVKFNSDGTLFGAVSWERTKGNPSVQGFVKIIETKSAKLLRRIDLDNHPAAALDFSKDGKFLLTATWGFFIKYHDLETGRTKWEIDLSNVGYYTALQSADISPDGTRVIAAGKDNRIRLIDAANGNILRLIEPHEGHSQWVNAVRFSHDGIHFASGSDDGLLKIWDTASAKELFTFRGHERGINGLAWFSDNKRLATTSSDGTIKIWDLTKPGERTLDVCMYGPWYAPLSADGKMLAAACSDQNVGIWNIRTSKLVLSFDSISANCASFSKDDRYLAVGGNDKMVHLFDLVQKKKIQSFPGHQRGVFGIAFLDEKGMLASAGDESIRLWNIAHGTEDKILSTPGLSPYTIQCTPDKKQLVVGFTNGLLHFYSTDTWLLTDSIRAGASLNYFSIHPSGKLILTGGAQGQIHLIALEKQKTIRQLSGHGKLVYGLTFHPSLPLAMSVSYDRTLKIWDTDNAVCTLTLFGFQNELFTVSITGDGNTLIITETEGIVHVIDLFS